MKNALILITLLAPLTAAADDGVARIQAMPIAQCQHDLTQLRAIHQQMRSMTQAEGEQFLQSVAENIRAQGLALPPPPAPCSAPDLALEERCGDVAQAKRNCGSIADARQ